MHAMAMIALLAAQPGVPRQPPQAKAFLEAHYQPIESVRELPPALAAALRQHLHDTPIADRGEPFNASDVRSEDDPPTRRFLAAGTSPSGSFIAYEHGGLGHHYHLLMFGPEIPQPRRLVHCVGIRL